MTEISKFNEENAVGFQIHGTYCISNCCGYLVMISDCGTQAKLGIRQDDWSIKATDWLDIDHCLEQDIDDGEEIQFYIDPDGFNVPLNEVMRYGL